jgi:hypothetical protein
VKPEGKAASFALNAARFLWHVHLLHVERSSAITVRPKDEKLPNEQKSKRYEKT